MLELKPGALHQINTLNFKISTYCKEPIIESCIFLKKSFYLSFLIGVLSPCISIITEIVYLILSTFYFFLFFPFILCSSMPPFLPAFEVFIFHFSPLVSFCHPFWIFL